MSWNIQIQLAVSSEVFLVLVCIFLRRVCYLACVFCPISAISLTEIKHRSVNSSSSRPAPLCHGPVNHGCWHQSSPCRGTNFCSSGM